MCGGGALAFPPSRAPTYSGALWESRMELLLGQPLITGAWGRCSVTSTDASCPASLSFSQHWINPCPASGTLPPGHSSVRRGFLAPVIKGWEQPGSLVRLLEGLLATTSHSDDDNKSIIAIMYCEVVALVPRSSHVLSPLILKTVPLSGCHHHPAGTGGSG